MSKLIRISADLISGRDLNNLFGCCESQKTVSINVLRGELEAIEANLKTIGIAVKDAYTENQALRKELEAVKADLDTALCKGYEIISGNLAAPDYYIKQITIEKFNQIKADAVIAAKQCSALSHNEGVGVFGEGFDTAIMQYDAHLDKYASSLINNKEN